MDPRFPSDTMNARFAGRTAIITGGARGMGEATVRALAAEGARVVIADLREELGLALADEIGHAAHFTRLDVSSASSWDSLLLDIPSDWGPIDVLVNNAGIGFGGTVLDHREDHFSQIMDVNVRGVYLGMRTIVPIMVGNARGSVINIASIAGNEGWEGGLAYAASKWAIRGLSLSAAVDLTGTGVRVNTVNPGIIDTAMLDGGDFHDFVRHQPLQRYGRPDEVARMILFLASDEASFCTGGEYNVDGGYGAGHVRNV